MKSEEYARGDVDEDVAEMGGREVWREGSNVARRVSARFVCRYA